ncbi:hypothetical protein RGQ29_027917 [Quercus rubra]|uniref:Uncharacterized protein n=1 Tax=Quercus rubra TaxID=3512 RepID=A0AAN7ILY8_QUERU|nr:hypothetical protein RGQ29_027917 [Quercus rubra]
MPEGAQGNHRVASLLVPFHTYQVKRLTVTGHTKDETFKCILQLRKLHDQESSCYYQCRSLLKNARKLAQKKDVAALGELSCGQIDRFMSQWNNSKAFRDEYDHMIKEL